MKTLSVAAVGFTLFAAASLGALAGSAGARGTSGYGGLGATVKAFYAHNPHGSRFPPLGVAYYKVDATKHDRVTAYHVTINARPPYSARERVTLVGGVNLPSDARETRLNRDRCIVWRSRTLQRLIGMRYAAATTGSEKTTAYMQAERTPHC